MPDASALLALWNGVAPALDADYNAWHAEEHVPERLTVPGILWARRYAAFWPQSGPRYLTLYGLQDAQVLQSAPYQRLLREPTPMSARMRPHLCDLSRWVCALRTPHSGPNAAGLRVQTFETVPLSTPQALLAERLPDAAPLPWLQGGQEHAVRGDWLLATALPQRPTGPASDAMVYAALPIGPI